MEVQNPEIDNKIASDDELNALLNPNSVKEAYDTSEEIEPPSKELEGVATDEELFNLLGNTGYSDPSLPTQDGDGAWIHPAIMKADEQLSKFLTGFAASGLELVASVIDGSAVPEIADNAGNIHELFFGEDANKKTQKNDEDWVGKLIDEARGASEGSFLDQDFSKYDSNYGTQAMKTVLNLPARVLNAEKNLEETGGIGTFAGLNRARIKTSGWLRDKAEELHAEKQKYGKLATKSISKDGWTAALNPVDGSLFSTLGDIAVEGGPSLVTSILGVKGLDKIGKAAGLLNNPTVAAGVGAGFMTAQEGDVIGHQVARDAYEQSIDAITGGEYMKNKDAVISQAYGNAVERGASQGEAEVAAQKAGIEFRRNWGEEPENKESHEFGVTKADQAYKVASGVNMLNVLLNMGITSQVVNGRYLKPYQDLPSKSKALRGLNKRLHNLSNKNVVTKALSKTGKVTTGVVYEGIKEYIEEGVVNVLAEKAGLNKALGKDYSLSDMYEDVTSLEAQEQGFAGFVLGSGSPALAGITNNLLDQKLVDYNKKINKIKNELYNTKVNKDVTFAEQAHSIYSQSLKSKEAVNKLMGLQREGLQEEAELYENMLVGEQVLAAKKTGTLGGLYSFYEDIIEQAVVDKDMNAQAKGIQTLAKVKQLAGIHDSTKHLANSYKVFRNRVFQDAAIQSRMKLDNQQTKQELVLNEAMRPVMEKHGVNEDFTEVLKTKSDKEILELPIALLNEGFNNPLIAEITDASIRSDELTDVIDGLNLEYSKAISNRHQTKLKYQNEAIQKMLGLKAAYKEGKITKENLDNEINKTVKEYSEHAPEGTLEIAGENIKQEPKVNKSSDNKAVNEQLKLFNKENEKNDKQLQDIETANKDENGGLGETKKAPDLQNKKEAEQNITETSNKDVQQVENTGIQGIIDKTKEAANRIADKIEEKTNRTKFSTTINVTEKPFIYGTAQYRNTHPKAAEIKAAHFAFREALKQDVKGQEIQFEVDTSDYIHNLRDELSASKNQDVLLNNELKAAITNGTLTLELLEKYDHQIVNIPIKAKLDGNSYVYMHDGYSLKNKSKLAELAELKEHKRRILLAFIENKLYNETIQTQTSGAVNLTNELSNVEEIVPNPSIYVATENNLYDSASKKDNKPLHNVNAHAKGTTVLELDAPNGTKLYVDLKSRELNDVELHLFNEATARIANGNEDSLDPIMHPTDTNVKIAENIKPEDILRLLVHINSTTGVAYRNSDINLVNGNIFDVINYTNSFELLGHTFNSIDNFNYNTLLITPTTSNPTPAFQTNLDTNNPIIGSQIYTTNPVLVEVEHFENPTNKVPEHLKEENTLDTQSNVEATPELKAVDLESSNTVDGIIQTLNATEIDELTAFLNEEDNPLTAVRKYEDTLPLKEPDGNIAPNVSKKYAKNMAYAAFIDPVTKEFRLNRNVYTVTREDIKDYFFRLINEAKAADKNELADKLFDTITNDYNLDKITSDTNSYIKQIVGDVDQKREDLNENFTARFEDSTYNVNPDVRANKYTKLMLATLYEKDQNGRKVIDQDTGLAVVADYSKVYNMLLHFLSDIYPINDTSATQRMFAELDRISTYQPIIRQLVSRINKQGNTEWIRANMYQSFNLSAINFKTIQLNKSNNAIQSFTALDPIRFNATNVVLSKWSKAYSLGFAQYSEVYNNIRSIIGDLNGATNKNEDLVVKNAIIKLQQQLNKAGIDITTNSLNYFLDTRYTSGDNINRTKALVNDIITNILQSNGPNVRPDNQFSIALAEAVSMLDINSYSSMVNGPENKPYWKYTQKTKADRILHDLNNKEGYIDFILNSNYSGHSYILRRAANDPTYLDNFKIIDILSARTKALKGINPTEAVAPKKMEIIDSVIMDMFLLFGSQQSTPTESQNKNSYARFFSFEAKSRSDVYLQIPSNMLTIDKTVQENDVVTGISKTHTDLFIEYFADEFTRMYRMQDLRNKGENIKLVNLDKNYKKSFMFPELSMGAEAITELGAEANQAIHGLDMKELLTAINSGKVADFLKGLQPLRDYISFEAAKYINKQITTYKNEGVLNSDMTSNMINISQFSNSVLNSNMTNFIANYEMNSMFNALEINKVFYSDPANYKIKGEGLFVNFAKRTPAMSSAGIVPDLIPNGENEFSVVIAHDNIYDKELYSDAYIEEHFGKEYIPLFSAYRHNEHTDAQGYITLDRWKQIMQSVGRWDDTTQTLYDKAVAGEATLSDMQAASNSMQPLKGTVTSKQKIDNQIYDLYLKYSQAVLFPQLTKSFPNLDILRTKLEGLDKPAEIVYQTGSKITNIQPVDIHTDNTYELTNDNVTIVDNTDYKIQVDLQAKYHKKEKENIGTQVVKSVVLNMDLDKEYNGVLGSTTILNLDTAFSELLDRAGDRNLSKYKNLEKTLANMADVSEDSKQALLNGASIDMIPEREKIIQTLFSDIKKSLSPKFNGGAFIQMSPALASTIKVEKEGGQEYLKDTIILPNYDGMSGTHYADGVFKPAQIMIPFHFVKTIPGFQEKSDEEIRAILNNTSKEDLQEILTGVAYRIPTQGPSSIDAVEIVGILPAIAGDTIIVANEGTTKFGFDFDIDKLYVMLGDIELDGDKLKAVPPADISNPAEASDGALKNYILSTYLDIIKEDHFDFVVPLDNLTKPLKDFAKEYHDNGLANDFTFYSTYNQLKIKEMNLKAQSGLTGTFAVGLTDSIRNRAANLMLSHELMPGKRSLSVKDSDNGTPVTNMLTALLSLSVDVANEPVIIQLGINPITANVVKYMVDMGFDTDVILSFIGQPIIKKYSKEKEFDRLQTSNIFEKNEPVRAEDRIARNFTATPEFELEQGLQFMIDGSKGDKSPLKNRLKGFKEKPVLEYDDLSYRVYKTFKMLEERANEYANVTKASRYDVKGAGKNFKELIQSNEILRSVLKLSTLEGFNEDMLAGDVPRTMSDFMNLEWKFFETHLGAAYKNSVLLINDMTYGKTYENTAAFKRYFEYVRESIGRDYITDEDTIKEISNGYYSYIMSDLFNGGLNYTDMFTGDSSMANRKAYLSINNKAFAESTLSKILIVDINSPLKTITKNNFMKLNTVTQQRVKDEWTDMLEGLYGEEVQKFAEDLVYYAYATSGANFNTGSFYDLLPFNALKRLGIINYFNDIRNVTDINEFTRILDQTVQNNPESRLVDTRKKVPDLNDRYYVPEGYKAMKSESLYTYRQGRLYKRVQDITHDKAGNPEYEVGMYVPMNKLGIRGKRNRVVEFGYNVSESNFELNNQSIPTEAPEDVQILNKPEDLMVVNNASIAEVSILDAVGIPNDVEAAVKEYNSMEWKKEFHPDQFKNEQDFVAYKKLEEVASGYMENDADIKKEALKLFKEFFDSNTVLTAKQLNNLSNLDQNCP